ncbi:MAG: hypothetical protein K5894_08725 [Lachnospiraceae bacterium]|nr:hypothetical protein [Lachnospiraceae bacterium]
MRFLSVFLLSLLMFTQIVNASDWPLSTDLFAQGYTSEEVEELAGKPKGSTISSNKAKKKSSVSRNAEAAAESNAGSNGQYLPPQYSYDELEFNEYRVNSHGRVYYQTENRGSRMDGFDEFYYVNEH